MYHPIQSQPDCVSAWREAVRVVDGQTHHEAHNVIIDVVNPIARSTMEDPIVREVDTFLKLKGTKAVETVANTIFPAALYRRYGAPAFFNRFTDNVLPKVRRNGDRWSGYYFERMIALPQDGGGESINQLIDIIARLRDPSVSARNKFELSVRIPTMPPPYSDLMPPPHSGMTPPPSEGVL